MEAGELQIGKRATGGGWQDITAETVDRHKKMITTYEGILKVLSTKLQGGF
jgi:hypothetical protein